MELLSRIISSKVILKESFASLDNYSGEVPEGYLVATALPKRRKEFNATRVLARAVLAEFGVEEFKVLKGSRGEPIWPSGMVGSITHCEGYRAVAASSKLLLKSIGIDAEPHTHISDKVLRSIAVEREIEHISTLKVAKENIHWAKLLFSAKEAVYKAWFPLTKRWLGFQEAELSFSLDTLPITQEYYTGTFVAKILVDSTILTGEKIPVYYGRWIIADEYLATVVEV